MGAGGPCDAIRKMAYRVSTVLSSFLEVQFNGQETWTWYSQVPLLTLQYAILGRTVDGNDWMRGVNDQDERFAMVKQLGSNQDSNADPRGWVLRNLMNLEDTGAPAHYFNCWSSFPAERLRRAVKEARTDGSVFWAG